MLMYIARRLLLCFVDSVAVCSCRFDSEGSPENRLYLDCFCVVAGGIGVSMTHQGWARFPELGHDERHTSRRSSDSNVERNLCV